MVKMFQEKMAGGSNDPDDLIVRAFKAYEVEGKIEAEMFRHALANFGDKFNKAEIDDIFGEFEVDDDGFIESKSVIGLFVAGGGEEKKEEAPPAEEAHLQRLKLKHLLMMVERRRKRRRRLPSKCIFCHKCHNLSHNDNLLQRMPPADKQQTKRFDQPP